MSLLAFSWCHCEFLPWWFTVFGCMNGLPHFISGATKKKSDSFNMGKLLWVYCAKPKHANTGPSVASHWGLLQRVRDGSVSWRSHRLPFCVTLWCVITSRIIGSVGGNTNRGYWGQSDSEKKTKKQRSQEQWLWRCAKVTQQVMRSHFVVIGFSRVTFMDRQGAEMLASKGKINYTSSLLSLVWPHLITACFKKKSHVHSSLILLMLITKC